MYQKPKAMKHSSILMSSFGALLILISVNEYTLKSSDIISKPNQNEIQIKLIPVKNEALSATPAYTVSKNKNDSSDLKFNDSDCVTAETGNNEMPEVADYTFLKFNVSDYIETEIGALPEDSHFDYLKFDVNSYIKSPYNGEALPSADLDYLKFDVQKYVDNDSECKHNELPEE